MKAYLANTTLAYENRRRNSNPPKKPKPVTRSISKSSKSSGRDESSDEEVARDGPVSEKGTHDSGEGEMLAGGTNVQDTAVEGNAVSDTERLTEVPRQAISDIVDTLQTGEVSQPPPQGGSPDPGSDNQAAASEQGYEKQIARSRGSLSSDDDSADETVTSSSSEGSSSSGSILRDPPQIKLPRVVFII
jgi:hypothetical protein